jgi:hypothetical protein
MSILETKKLIKDTIINLSKGNITNDKCLSIVALIEAECHLLDVETRRLEYLLDRERSHEFYTNSMKEEADK